MKESRFLDLLNLYIDQQIEPKDAALLEEEILRNPGRRRTYVEYCRMHRACAMVFEQSVAGEGTERADLEEMIERTATRERSWSPFAIAGGFAALAAAIAVMAYVRSGSPEQPDNFASFVPPGVEEVVEIPTMRVASPVTVPAPEMGDLRVFFVQGGSDAGAPAGKAPLAPELAWMNFRLSPLVTSNSQPLLFEPASSSAGRTNSGVLSSAIPPEVATETVGFQFQK